MDEKTPFSFKKIFENDKTRKILIILGFIGIALIAVSSMFDFSFSDNKNEIETSTVDTYRNSLETDLKEIIESIEGVGSCEVMLTIENSAESIYLEKTDTLTKQIEPKIRGVLVVCEGGDNPVVTERIFSALKSVLGISSNEICVTKLSTQKETTL